MAVRQTQAEKIIHSFSNLNVLVIGDVMIDSYLWGKVSRISPEAPVPVVAVSKKEHRLGGAANVAINVQSLGATPWLCSVIGSDGEARLFIDLLQQRGMRTDGLVQSAARATTVKTRVIGNNHQLIRVDEEHEDEITSGERVQLLDRIKGMLRSSKIDVIIFEDYDKGVIGKQLIAEVVKVAKQKKIPVAADPKKKNFNFYGAVTLLKPNLKELREGMKLDFPKGTTEEIIFALKKLADLFKIENVLVTMSEKGAIIYSKNNAQHIPAHIRNIADVSGAGDTVISVAAMSLAAGASPELAATLANLAGGLVCESVGVVPIERNQLLKEVKKEKLG